PLPVAEEVQALKRELGINNNERMLLSVGRLSQEKAHIDLLRAFKILRELYSEIEVRLVIVGDGAEHAKLEAAAASLGISAQLKFAGQVRNVRPYYAAADVLANSSESEGSPYVLLE